MGIHHIDSSNFAASRNVERVVPNQKKGNEIMSKHSTVDGKPAKRLQKRITDFETSMSGKSANSYPQSMAIRNTLRRPGSNKK